MDNYVITISRACGSGGSIIGEAVAKDLGISYINRELLRMASDDSGINEELFAKVDEKLENRLFFKTTKNVYSGELLPPDSDDFTSMDNLFNYQAKVIKELAQTESYVIIGRCADYILKDFPNVIRIFVHAPMDFCIENMRALHSLSDRELEKLIRKTDKYRADYYAYHTGRSWQDARNFDLCLNSKDLGFEKCIRLVKEYVNIKLEL